MGVTSWDGVWERHVQGLSRAGRRPGGAGEKFGGEWGGEWRRVGGEWRRVGRVMGRVLVKPVRSMGKVSMNIVRAW